MYRTRTCVGRAATVACGLIAIVLANLCCGPVPALAVDWINVTGSPDPLYHKDPNWAGGSVPTSVEDATFNAAATYEVWWTGDTGNTTTANLFVDDGDVTFRQDGSGGPFTHNVTSNATIDIGSLTLGTSGNPLNLSVGGTLFVRHGGQLDVLFGSDASSSGLRIGTLAGAAAGVAVDGAGSKLNVSSISFLGQNSATGTLVFQNGSTGNSLAGTVHLADSGVNGSTGVLEVLSGSVLSTGSIDATTGAHSGQSATITVDGAGSTLTQTGSSTLELGTSSTSTGELNVTGGGTFNSGTGDTTVNATGTVNVDGGTLQANGDVVIDGGALNRSSSGAFNLATAKTLTAQNGAQVDFTGDYSLDGATAFNVNSGADLSATGHLDVGAGTNGTLTIDGSGSTLSTGAAASWWGTNGGTASVTIRNEASAALGDIVVAQGSAASTFGTWNVEGGADVMVGNISIADGGTSGGSGEMTVTGSGSTVSQDYYASLTVGHATEGTATLTVADDAEFYGGMGDTTINATGTIDLDGGTLFTVGDVVVDGGTLSSTNGTFLLNTGANVTAQNDAQVSFANDYGYTIAWGITYNVESGADLSSTTYLDVGVDDLGTLVVDGFGSTLTVAESSYWGSFDGTAVVTLRNEASADLGEILVARGTLANANGTWNVESGAHATVGNIAIAAEGSTGSMGAVTVTGNGSTVTQNGASTLVVGHASEGTATLTVQSTGTFTTGTGDITVNATGTIDVDGGTFHANGQVLLDGGTLTCSNGDLFILGAGNKLRAENNAQVTFSGTWGYGIGDATIFDIRSGADLFSATWLDIGFDSDGTLIVDGDGSTLTTTDASVWGGGGATADVTIRNQAGADLGDVVIAHGPVANSNGTWSVESDADVIVDNIYIAIGGTSGGSGELTVTGSGSTVTQYGASELVIGHATDGTATLTVTDSGTFSTGTGVITVNATGTIDLDGGTLDLNGPIVGDGVLNFSSGQLNVNDSTQMVGFGTGTLRIGSFTTAALSEFDPTKGLSVAGTAIVDPGVDLSITGGAASFGNLIVTSGGSVTYSSGSLDTGVLQAATGSVLDISVNFASVSLGDAGAVNGVFIEGTLNVGANTVTLLDSNDAVFDSGALVTLGHGIFVGTLAAANGITLDFGGNITGYGTVDTPNDPATPLINNGHITGNSVVEPITLTGYVKGVGTCDNCNVTGTEAPGFSAAAVNRGSVSYNGTLEIEIGGTTAGSQYDQLNHILGAGIADLGGTLDVTLIDGFSPTAGDTFDIITAMDAQNTFDVELLPALGGGLMFDVLYGTTLVQLVVAGIEGDYNFDGIVDAADYTVWRDSLGQSGPALAADGSGNGMIDEADYDVWKANFGQSAGSGTGTARLGAAQLAVPEPGTWVLCLAAVVLLGARRRVRW